jgi:hypothetical protein
MYDSIHNLRDALEWLDRRIREEAELDGEMSNDHAIQLGFITNMLEKFPPRNCDVGTEQEQHKRFVTFCNAHIDCVDCPIKAYWTKALSCGILWGQMPYEESDNV